MFMNISCQECEDDEKKVHASKVFIELRDVTIGWLLVEIISCVFHFVLYILYLCYNYFIYFLNHIFITCTILNWIQLF